MLALAAGGCGSDEQSGDAAVMDAAVDASAACTVDAGHCLVVDDAGVSHGCAAGSMGPGDRDDGGGLARRPPRRERRRDEPSVRRRVSRQRPVPVADLLRLSGQRSVLHALLQLRQRLPARPSLGCGGQGVCRIGVPVAAAARASASPPPGPPRLAMVEPTARPARTRPPRSVTFAVPSIGLSTYVICASRHYGMRRRL